MERLVKHYFIQFYSALAAVHFDSPIDRFAYLFFRLVDTKAKLPENFERVPLCELMWFKLSPSPTTFQKY